MGVPFDRIRETGGISSFLSKGGTGEKRRK
jgi:hypothetical protein